MPQLATGNSDPHPPPPPASPWPGPQSPAMDWRRRCCCSPALFLRRGRMGLLSCSGSWAYTIGIGPFTHGCAALGHSLTGQRPGRRSLAQPPGQRRPVAIAATAPCWNSPRPRAPAPARVRRGSSGRQARDRRRQRSGGEPARWSGRGVAAPRLLHRGLAGTPRAGRPQAPAASSSRARRRARGPVTPASRRPRQATAAPG